MKKPIIIVTSLVIASLVGLGAYLACHSTKEKQEQEQVATSKIENVKGIEKSMIQDSSKTFSKVTFSYLDKSIEITPNTKCGDIPATFTPIPNEKKLPSGKRTLVLRNVSDNKNVLAIGGVNNTKEDISFKDSSLVYFYFNSSDDWALNGVKCGMPEKKVIEILGEPSQRIDGEDVVYAEYHTILDNHTYSISITYDKQENVVSEVKFNLDNTPIQEDIYPIFEYDIVDK